MTKAEELISDYKLAKSNLYAHRANMDNMKSVTQKVVDSFFLDVSKQSCQRSLDKAAERFAECSENLTEAITGLGDSRYIDVLTLLVLEEYSIRRTAELMGYSKRSINNLKAEALRKMNEVLEK